jgi:hypothetical protein
LWSIRRINLTEKHKTLLMGALKSGVSAATGMILSLNIVDPEHFSVTTFGGWKHLGLAIGVTIITSEARYWKQWADTSDNGGPKP